MFHQIMLQKIEKVSNMTLKTEKSNILGRVAVDITFDCAPVGKDISQIRDTTIELVGEIN